MPLYTGALNTFGLATFVNRSPRGWLVPSNSGTTGAIIFPVDPVPLVFFGSSEFEVFAAATEFVNPVGTHFKLIVEWLNGAGIPVGYDSPPWEFHTTAAGGDLTSMMKRPLGRGEWWVGTGLGVPSEAVAGDLILNPVTGNFDQVKEA